MEACAESQQYATLTIQSACMMILAHQILRIVDIGESISMVDIVIYISGAHETSICRY